MSNQPTMPEMISQLRQYQSKNTLSNVALATEMATVGWGATNWSEVHIAALMIGTAQPTDAEIEFIKRFLLLQYYIDNS